MAHSVLLTGGAGFIGSHTAVELLQAGYDVVIADDLSNCTPDVADRIGRITGRTPAFHRVDVADRAALDEYANDPYHCSVVKKHMHAVAKSSVTVDYEY